MVARAAVTFDLWHTLVHLEVSEEARYLERQLDAAARVLAAAPDAPGAPSRSTGELREAFARELRAAVVASHEGRSVTPAEQIARAAEATGRLARPEAYVRELEHIVATTRFIAAPGAREAIERLRSQGYAVGVISNTVGEPGRFLRRALVPLGFDAAVERYVFSDEEAWAKPSPEIFRATLTRLGSEASRAVHVGDSWADIEGARRAGLRAGVLFTGLQQYAPQYRDLNFAPEFDRGTADFQLDDLRSLAPLVGRILPAE